MANDPDPAQPTCCSTRRGARHAMRRGSSAPTRGTPARGRRTSSTGATCRRPDRPVDRLRSADPVRLRLRRPDRPARGRQGRRADQHRSTTCTCCSTTSRIEQMNTSMTINGTAMWLLALYVALARERGVDTRAADRHHPERHHQGVPGARHLHLPARATACGSSPRCTSTASRRCRSWNASNICSYHLQEAGATPVQELAFALANAIGLLDLHQGAGPLRRRPVRACRRAHQLLRQRGHPVRRGDVQDARVRRAVGRDHAATATASPTRSYRRFRYGVQVNSLGLTEAQPENNAWRILIEALGVTLSRDARCRALQLPAWNEALSLPRPWDQQWSLRLQQILAYETDLLEYPDLFEGSVVVEAKVAELKDAGARPRSRRILGMGGVIAAIETGYMKSALVRSMGERMQRASTAASRSSSASTSWTEGLPSPLLGGDDGGVFKIDDAARAPTPSTSLDAHARRRDAERAQRGARRASKAAAAIGRVDDGAVDRVRPRARHHRRVGRRPARGVRRVPPRHRRRRPAASASTATAWTPCAARIQAPRRPLGHRPKLVVGKPGLDGHSQRRRGHRRVGPPRRLRRRSTRASASAPTRSCSPPSRRAPTSSAPRCCAARTSSSPSRSSTAWRGHGADKRVNVVFGGIIPSRRHRAAARDGRRARLHAVGLQPDRHHGVDRRRDRGARRRERGRSSSRRSSSARDAAKSRRSRPLVSLFEDRRAPRRAPQRAQVLAELARSARALGRDRSASPARPARASPRCSSRVVARAARRSRPTLTIAVLAVDPSSHISGRRAARRPHAHAARRRASRACSSAARRRPTSSADSARPRFRSARLLARLFDCVLVETVGIGQSEADIRHLADRRYLVLQPLGGDEVQFLKAGIMEMPDASS